MEFVSGWTAPETTAVRDAGAVPAPDGTGREERAVCVQCGEPTDYPASTRGATLCPVCEWHEAERVACSC
ncbi:hypothetical protein [Streptomyces pini]|uniref:Uncharacterized protein n=1 Tax=Streptomyces pini TaxID=1520580 RepID=A0A1I4DJR1_9ACTN|nr:hypothetical protein [Streptomyces pini]SFK92990.1 hypothetical protein SAMN05192584_110122 [Streptomyces pini]